MHRFIALLVCAITAPALFAGGLHFGPAITFSDLVPGEPPLVDQLINAWPNGAEVDAVFTRATYEHSQTVLMHIREDGTADPAALVPLPIPPSGYVAAPLGDGVMVAWTDVNATTVARFDRYGNTLASSTANDAPLVLRGMSCNATRCLISGIDRSIVVDANGHAIKTLTQSFDATVASPAGFLALAKSSLTLLDNDGNMKVSFQTTLTAVDLSYDGSRYVLSGLPAVDFTTDVRVWTIDPASGFASLQTTIAVQLAGYTNYWIDRCSLAWNGSQYLLLLHMRPPFPVQPVSLGPDSSAFMRLNDSFQPIDAAAHPLLQNRPNAQTRAIGVTDGFRLLFPWSLNYRTAFIGSSNGNVIPSPDGDAIVNDRASQIPIAAAASRDQLLGVWTEVHGNQTMLVAGRIDRDGNRLGVRMGIAGAEWFGAVCAASSGDGFVVTWQENPTGDIVGVAIDGAGNTAGFTLFHSYPWPVGAVHLEFVNGAYQLSFFGGAHEVVAATITPAGNVVQTDSFHVDGSGIYDGASAHFDGQRTVALWTKGNSVFSATKDIAGPGVLTQEVLRAAAPSTYGGIELARDGDGFIALFSLWDGTTAVGSISLYLNRVSRDGRLTLSGNGVPIAQENVPAGYDFLRIDAGWYVTHVEQVHPSQTEWYWQRELIPFSASTLRSGAPITMKLQHYAEQLLGGANGEALLIDAADVPVASGFAMQMTAQLGHALPSHPRAGGK